MSRHELIEQLAQSIVKGMSPLEIGLTVYPSARPVPLAEVPDNIITDYLARYTEDELKAGQFLEVTEGKFTFFMNHETKRRKSS